MSKFCSNLLILSLFISVSISAKEYHVSKSGNDSNVGSILKPFLSVSQAAKTAYAGDTITVHAGVYREWINPILVARVIRKELCIVLPKAKKCS